MTTTSTSPSRTALARALTNDRNGVISASDAKTIVKEGLVEIQQAKDPQLAFSRSQQTINAAMALVSPTGAAQQTLQTFSTSGQNVVSVRLGELAGAGNLPQDVKDTLKGLLSDADVIAPNASFRTDAVKGDATKGFSFEFTAGNVAGKAHALRYADRWVLSPVPLTKKNLDDATTAMRAWFDTDFAPDMLQMGATAAEMTAAKNALVPRFAFFPGSSDPYDLVAQYAVVLSFDNETGSDHGLYLGIDLSNGNHEAYAFN